MIYTHTATAIVAAVLAATGAWKVQNWRFAAQEHAREARAAQVQRQQAEGADKAAEVHEVQKEKIRVEYQQIFTEVERVVEKPVYRNVCLDGLRQLERAIGAAGSAPGKPAPAVPEPDAAR